VGAELFRADGRTDMTQLTVASRNFANASKIQFMSDRKLTASSLQNLIRWGVYCTSHTEHIYKQCGQNEALRNVKTGGTHSYHTDLELKKVCLPCPVPISAPMITDNSQTI
jgi:hypothetical protein